MARITPLTPKEIRKFVAGQLATRMAAAYPNLAVFQGRPRPALSDNDPQLNVFSAGNTASNRSRHMPDFDVIERVNVFGTLKLAEGGDYDDSYEALADLVDDLEEAIKDAIWTNRRIIATFRTLPGATTEKGVDVEGDDMRGYVAIEFRFERSECRTPRAEDANPDGDLEQLDINQLFGEHGVLVTHDGDTIVTHEGDSILVSGNALLLRPIYRLRIVTHGGDNLVTHGGDQIVSHRSQGYDGA